MARRTLPSSPGEMRRAAKDLEEKAKQLREDAQKQERMATADGIPTCPDCGGRTFMISAWTLADQSISFEEDEEHGDWGDDYAGGDHTDEWFSATCTACGTDVQEVLEKFGHKFYGNPEVITDAPEGGK